MPLQINIRHLEAKEIRLQGQLPAADLELDQHDELAQARQPLRYDLTAQMVGNGILLQGRLELPLDCECARCLKPFEHLIELPLWTAHLALEGPDRAAVKDDLVDLTPCLREDILLEWPQHPLCGADCAGVPNRAMNEKMKGVSQTEGSSAWAELNKLKF